MSYCTKHKKEYDDFCDDCWWETCVWCCNREKYYKLFGKPEPKSILDEITDIIKEEVKV